MITQCLNDIFEREHTMSLDRLKTISKRDARQFLRELPTMQPFVEAFVMMMAFEGAAFPLDQEMLTYLIEEEIIEEGTTLAFAKQDARKLLDLPDAETLEGLRDRAILSVGLQVGLRRAEIAALKVGDLHQNRGYDSLRVTRKGGRRDALAINPQTAARLRAYLDRSGHADDMDGPLFRPLAHNGKATLRRRAMDPDAIDRIVRKYATTLGLARGYSAHSMRATFITTALENGAQLEDVQKAAGHRDPSTTKLYDRRGYNPEKAASFFATY